MEYFGTLGPSCADETVLYQMFQAGVTGMRLNLSHGTLAGSSRLIETYQRAAQRAGVRAQLMIDLQGPELRIGELQEPLPLHTDDQLRLGADGIPIPSILLESLCSDLDVLLDDGTILLRTIQCDGRGVLCSVVRGGILQSRKSIAVSAVAVHPPTLTGTDLENLEAAAAFGVTSILLPFVRGREDLLTVRRVLEQQDLQKLKVIAKIENRTGMDRLDEIIAEADEVCIARGDLGNAMPLWELPEAQKRIAAKCRAAKRPFIIVTQMLHSMMTAPVPTRAEVSDIFNAVLDGAATLMLTGETAVGKYPVEAVNYLVRTARQAEEYGSGR